MVVMDETGWRVGGEGAWLWTATSPEATFPGSLPRRALRLVRTWQRLHQDELERAWERAARQEVPGSIEPLP
jgi:hypothetical protein